jgi:fibronectin-binding autotransporter adhesin
VLVTFRTSAGGGVSGSLTLSNTISGSGSLDLVDTNSTLTLAGPGNADNHTGGTIIDGSINVGGVTFIMNTINPNTANGLVENAVGATPAGSIANNGVVTPPLNYVGGNGTNSGEVSIGSVLWPGAGGKFSTFGTGTLDTQPGGGGSPPEGGFVWSLGTVTNAGGGFNDLLNVNGDLDTGGSIPIFINPVGLLTTNGVYTLVQYTGNLINGFNHNSIAIYGGAATRYTFDETQGGGLVQLKVLTGVGTMRWTGASGNGQWDVQQSQNWTNTATATPVAPKDYQFLQSDQVVLDDSITASGGTNVLSITNGTVVLPATITVNATNNYTIQGAGSIGGGASILKTNSGTLTISNANTFTGTLTIQAGTLLANANNALGAASAVQVYGGSLQVNGANFSVVSTLITN